MFSTPPAQKIIRKNKQTSFIKTDTKELKEAVDVDYLLSSLGIKGRDSNKELRTSCPVHGGDNKSAFKFNKEKRTWCCFTHKCNDSYGNDIIGLIMAVLHYDFKQAVEYLQNLVGDPSLYKSTINSQKFEKDRSSFIKVKKPEYVSESALSIFRELRSQYFYQEKNGGFTPEILDYFEIAGGFTDSFSVVRDIIPIRSVTNKLLAYSLRDTRENPPDDDYKYILTEGFNKDKTLYNLNNVRIFGPTLPIILVEGFKSVWRLHSYGYMNTLSVMGSVVTQGQIDLLKSYALKGVIIMFDQDKAGREGTEISLDNFNKAGYSMCSSVNLNENEDDSPAELTKETIDRYLNEYF